MKTQKKQKILNMHKRISAMIQDLYEELREQKFPLDSPVMKNMVRMRLYSLGFPANLDQSIPIRDLIAKFKLDDIPGEEDHPDD